MRLARRPWPLDLLCACLVAGHQGRALDAATTAALADLAADPVRLVRLAGRHLVTPMLAACVADPDLGGRLPEAFRLYLGFVYAENGRRNRALRRQLAHAAACLNEAGIEPVLLKGAVRLVDDLYPDPAWRFMRDLDLLVPPDRLAVAADRLRSAGHDWAGEDAGRRYGRHRHLRGLKRPDDPVVVELHAEPLSDRLQGLCPARGVLARARPVDLDGARVRVPDATDQLAHLVAHDRDDAELGCASVFQLRSVFEAALLCRDERPAREVLARFAEAGARRWAWVQLALAARLFPEHAAPLPGGGVLGGAEARALVGLELLGGNGGLRRLFGAVRYRVGLLRRSSAYRRHVTARLLSPGWYR